MEKENIEERFLTSREVGERYRLKSPVSVWHAAKSGRIPKPLKESLEVDGSFSVGALPRGWDLTKRRAASMRKRRKEEQIEYKDFITNGDLDKLHEVLEDVSKDREATKNFLEKIFREKWIMEKKEKHPFLWVKNKLCSCS